MNRRAFTYGFSDAVTLDDAFPIVSNYIYVPTGGEGDIVYMNNEGNPMFIKSASAGYHPIAATQIMTTGDVYGVNKATTATNLSWCAGG